MKILKFTILTRTLVLGTLFLTLFFVTTGVATAAHDHDHGTAEASQNSKRLWCNEHGVYEDECFICHPELKSKVDADVAAPIHDHQPAEAAKNSNRLWCNEHGVYEDHLYMITDRQKRLKTQIDCGVMNTVFMKMSVLFAILN